MLTMNNVYTVMSENKHNADFTCVSRKQDADLFESGITDKAPSCQT